MSHDSPIGRREFLQKSTTAGAALGLVAAPAILSSRSPNDKIGLACVGVGTRGIYLMQLAQADPRVEVRIICDLYKGNIERAKKDCKYPDVRIVPDWQEAVAAAGVDGVIIATPDFWHAPMTVAAAKAKKDIYIEKGLCRTLPEAKAIRKAVQQSNVVMQLGHHYNSLPAYHRAREICQSGQLGKVATVRAYMDRTAATSAWKFYTRYDITTLPADASPETIDWARFIANAPKRPFDAERFFTWRCWWDYSTGISGDLMSHLWDGVNMVMGIGIPESVQAMGGTYYWKGDRDVPDTFHVMFDYPGKDLAFTFGCVCHNSHVAEVTHILGREKTMVLAQRSCRTYPAEWKPENRKRAAEMQKAVGEAMNLQPGDMPAPPDYAYKEGELQISNHVQDWLDCMRTRQTPRCGPQRAWEEAVTIAMSVEAFRRERKVRWDPAREEIV